MFPAREHLCMALPPGPQAPLFPAVSPYPCPAYRSPVCLPGYIPPHLIAWKTTHLRHCSGSKSTFVRVVKARKRNSFSIESLLSEDKFEVSDDKEPQLRRGPLPIVAGQIQTGGSSSHAAELNVWKNCVQGRDDGGNANNGALYVVHNFEDMVKHYKGTMTVSGNSDTSDSREVSRQIDKWRFTSAVHQKSKRVRTIFTSEQLQRLEKVFEEQQYMVGAERSLLASDLQLSEAQVKVWFQNRRIKWRKESHEKARAKLADYRSRRDDIRRKLGLGQRRTRFVAGDITKKKATANLDVMADEPIDALHNDGRHHE